MLCSFTADSGSALIKSHDVEDAPARSTDRRCLHLHEDAQGGCALACCEHLQLVSTQIGLHGRLQRVSEQSVRLAVAVVRALAHTSHDGRSASYQLRPSAIARILNQAAIVYVTLGSREGRVTRRTRSIAQGTLLRSGGAISSTAPRSFQRLASACRARTPSSDASTDPTTPPSLCSRASSRVLSGAFAGRCDCLLLVFLARRHCSFVY